MLIEHSRVIYSILSDMGIYYRIWTENHESNKDKLEKKQIKMMLSEESADDIKIRLIQNYAEAGTHGLGGFLTLILRMDNAINPALEFISILNHINYNTNDEIKKRYNKLINYLLKMTDILKKSIKNMRDNPEAVFNNTTHIHEIENEIDLIFREFLNYLYDNQDIDIRIILRFRDSIMVLEKFADRIRDLADLIRVLIYQ